MQEFLEYVIRGLAERPEEVRIDQSLKDDTVVYQISIHPDDMGRIIGKGGQTVNAIRTLLQTGSARRNQRSMLKVVEGEAALHPDPE